MSQILFLFLGYLGYLLLWAMVCAIGLALSVALRKPGIIQSIMAVSAVAINILNFLLVIGVFVFTVSLLLSGEIIWFLVMLFIGGSVFLWFLNLLQLPFIAIPTFFAHLVEEQSDVEIQTNQGVEVVDKDSKLNQQLALFFLVLLGVNFINLVVDREGFEEIGLGGFLFFPFLWTMVQSTVASIVFGVYQKIRGRQFFYPRKKVFITNIFRALSIIIGVMMIVIFLLEN